MYIKPLQLEDLTVTNLSTCHLQSKCVTSGYTALHPLTPAKSVHDCKRQFKYYCCILTVPSSVIKVLILALGQRTFTVLKSIVKLASSSLFEISQATGHPRWVCTQHVAYLSVMVLSYHCEIHLELPWLPTCACIGLFDVLNLSKQFSLKIH